MPVITQKGYKHLIQRQARVEREVEILRQLVERQADEANVRPAVLKRWERISQDLDRGKGRRFTSARAARAWLKRL